MESYKAGNTGVVDRIVTICDELLRLRVIDRKYYKTIMTCIKLN